MNSLAQTENACLSGSDVQLLASNIIWHFPVLSPQNNVQSRFYVEVNQSGNYKFALARTVRTMQCLFLACEKYPFHKIIITLKEKEQQSMQLCDIKVHSSWPRYSSKARCIETEFLGNSSLMNLEYRIWRRGIFCNKIYIVGNSWSTSRVQF